jgi:hypothetical protein
MGQVLAFVLLASVATAQAPLPVYGVAASSSYPGYGPENAVDGSPYTMWNAGVSGSAQPLLQLDLGGELPLSRLELLVAQYPSGYTSHQFVGYTSQWVSVDLGTYSGFTADGMLLTHTVTNRTPVRWVRVVTTYNASWVAWYEFRAYRHMPVGYLSASPGQCSVPYNGTFCDSPVQLRASIPTGEYGRVWVAAAPPGAPELGGWVFDTYGGSAQVGWIRSGTYRFELREGPYSNGTLLSAIEVSGQKQAPPPPPPPPLKRFAYYGARMGWKPETADVLTQTLGHTNLIWVAPSVDANVLREVVSRTDVEQVVLDGTAILFGGARCIEGGVEVPRLVYYDGTCTPNDRPELRLASERYRAVIGQLSYAQYQKIAWIFPWDEPDKAEFNLSDEDFAAAKQVITQVARNVFGQSAAIPRIGIIYSWEAIPLQGNGNPVGAASADGVAVNCYPISYGYAITTNRDGCGDDGRRPVLERFKRLKELVPGKRYFMVAETALRQDNDTPEKRGWLAENLIALRKEAQKDSSVEGVIGFNWRGLDPTKGDVSQGLYWYGPPALGTFEQVVKQEGQCLTLKGPCL